VRELRGSLKIHEHGIVITPSGYTPSAQSEAEEAGKTHISLIDGEQLVDLLIEHQVGVANVEHTVHVLDDDYWSEILGEDVSETETKSQAISKKKASIKVKFPLPVQANHKGQIYMAELLDLEGKVRYAGKIYETPSGAAKDVAVSWTSVNGWDFWKFLSPESGRLQKIGIIR
jgi:hypothetical protein